MTQRMGDSYANQEYIENGCNLNKKRDILKVFEITNNHTTIINEMEKEISKTQCK